MYIYVYTYVGEYYNPWLTHYSKTNEKTKVRRDVLTLRGTLGIARIKWKSLLGQMPKVPPVPRHGSGDVRQVGLHHLWFYPLVN